MAIGSFKRENLKFLVACLGTQTAFADALRYRTLTQPIVSSVLRGKRRFHNYEVRAIERWLCIPEGWMDRYPLRKAWTQLRKLRDMEPEVVRTVHALIDFAAKN